MPLPPPSSILSSLVGDKNAAIDYYSKGVTELERGISYRVHAKGKKLLPGKRCVRQGALFSKGEELTKVVTLRGKMEKNLEMAKDRVSELCEASLYSRGDVSMVLRAV